MLALPVTVAIAIAVPPMVAMSYRYDHTAAKDAGCNRCNDQFDFHGLVSLAVELPAGYESSAERMLNAALLLEGAYRP